MITLKVTITGKSGTDERTALRRVHDKFMGINNVSDLANVQYEIVEETVPLTLEYAAQRVIEHYPNGAAVQVDQMRRVLAGEYVCVPVEPTP